MPWTRETAESDRIIVQLDREIEDIVPGFLDRLLEDVESLLEALEQGDFEAIGMLGHRMRGSGGRIRVRCHRPNRRVSRAGRPGGRFRTHPGAGGGAGLLPRAG